MSKNVPNPTGATPSKETLDLIASLNAEFGKKPKKEKSDNEIARERNTAWHGANKPLGKGALAARPHPEDSQAWRPIARVTHAVIQGCSTCAYTCEFISGEYIKFRSVYGMNGGEILRRSAECSNLFLFDDLEQPLEDVIEWHYQEVTRCTGCIRTEQQAVAIWSEHLRKQKEALIQGKLDFDVEKPMGRSIEEALKEAK